MYTSTYAYAHMIMKRLLHILYMLCPVTYSDDEAAFYCSSNML